MDHLTKEEDNQDQVMLPADRFNKLSKPNESLVATRDNSSHVTLEGEEASILECIHNCADQDNSVV